MKRFFQFLVVCLAIGSIVQAFAAESAKEGAKGLKIEPKDKGVKIDTKIKDIVGAAEPGI